MQKIRRVARWLQHEHMRNTRIKIKPTRKERRAQQHARRVLRHLQFCASGVLPRQRPEEPREVLVRAVCARAAALARNYYVRHAVLGQVCAHLACTCACIGEYDHARAAAGASCQRVVAPDSLELRENLRVAVTRGVRCELEPELRGEAV